MVAQKNDHTSVVTQRSEKPTWYARFQQRGQMRKVLALQPGKFFLPFKKQAENQTKTVKEEEKPDEGSRERRGG